MKSETCKNESGEHLLSEIELRSVNGGNFAVGLLVSFALFLASEFDSIKQGWKESGENKSYYYDPCPCHCKP